MKTIYKSISVLAILVCHLTNIYAQSGPDYSHNFVVGTVVRVSGAKDTAAVNALPSEGAMRTVNYYDGLGFPSQTVSVGAVGGGTHDLVQHKEYDRYMRESKIFLPYADLAGGSGQGFRDGAGAATAAFYRDGSLTGMSPDSAPWSVTVYGNSTLDRVLEQGFPGEVWQPADHRTDTSGRTQVYGYGTCSSSGDDVVRLWKVASGGISSSGNYVPGRLVRQTLMGENWLSGRDGTVDVYTDYSGNTVLERRWLSEGGVDRALDTYYVYDVLGRLRYVLPPLLCDALSGVSSASDDDAGMRAYAYVYRYNGFGECIWKRLPGCSPVTMQYDRHHRLVLSQDGNQAVSGEWTSVWYDGLGRPCVRACGSLPYSGDVSGTEFTASYSGESGHVCGYVLSHSLPSGSELVDVTYYDNYDFISLAPESCRDSLRAYVLKPVVVKPPKPSGNAAAALAEPSSVAILPPVWDSIIVAPPVAPFPPVRDSTLIKDSATLTPVPLPVLKLPVVTTEYDRYGSSRVTGRVVWTVGDVRDALYSSCYYDDRGLVVQSHSLNQLGGWDSEKTVYSFTCQPVSRTLSHSVGTVSSVSGDVLPDAVALGNPLVERYTYTYDNMDRPLKITHRLGSGPETALADCSYDNLCRLSSDGRNGAEPLLTDYSYNIRSWQTGLSSGVFSEGLYYNDPEGCGASSSARFDGSLSASVRSFGGGVKCGYGYSYDGLGRVTGAEWLADGAPASGYGASYSYDGQGNVLSVARDSGESAAAGDDLMMAYSGNRLHAMSDHGGSMIPDHLAGSVPSGMTQYAYDANGNMTRDLNSGLTVMSYNRMNLPEELICASSDGVHSIRYLYSPDGMKLRVSSSGPSGVSDVTDYASNVVYRGGSVERILVPGGYVADGSYRFFVTDHLGSVRAVADSEGNVLEAYDYYPYGVEFPDGAASGSGVAVGGDADAVASDVVAVQPGVSDGATGSGTVPDGLGVTIQPYRFNGKESQKFAGLPYLDYGARFYHPLSSRWTTMDPMSEKYYSVSPYAFCSNNPVNFVDWDGMDIWELDNMGNVVNRIEDKEKDAFHIVEKNADGEWKRTGNEISFEYGTIGATHEVTVKTDKGEELTLTMFEVNGDANAQQLFEFMANPEVADVEWEHVKIGFEDSGRNVVGNSHVEGQTGIIGYLFTTGYTIRESNHNHPSRKGASDNDLLLAKMVQGAQPKSKFNVYVHPGIYVGFDKNSIVDKKTIY